MLSTEDVYKTKFNQNYRTNTVRKDETYKQIRSMNRSQSDPNILSINEQRCNNQLHRSIQAPLIHSRKEYSSLYILGPRNRIRVYAKQITESKYLFLLFNCLFIFYVYMQILIMPSSTN